MSRDGNHEQSTVRFRVIGVDITGGGLLLRPVTSLTFGYSSSKHFSYSRPNLELSLRLATQKLVSANLVRAMASSVSVSQLAAQKCRFQGRAAQALYNFSLQHQLYKPDGLSDNLGRRPTR